LKIIPTILYLCIYHIQFKKKSKGHKTTVIRDDKTVVAKSNKKIEASVDPNPILP
jgi:hypothetical protein